MATARIPTGLRFDEEILLKITYIAKKERRSFNSQMEYLALKCIEEYEEKKGEIVIKDEDRGLK